MLGDESQKLVLDAHRSEQTRSLLGYNTDAVNAAIRESRDSADTIQGLYDENGLLPHPEFEQAHILVSGLRRNYRNFLIYHQQRLDTLKDKYWEKGGLLRVAFNSNTDSRKNMTTADEAFIKDYHQLCQKLKLSYYEDADEPGMQGPAMMEAFDILSGGVDAEAPSDILVTVRVLQDAGNVETGSGARLNLTKGSQYSLPQEDVEEWVVNGYVEIV